MALVDLKKGQPIREKEFKSEKELHEVVEKHLPALLDMEVVASKYRISRGGEVDTLAIDRKNGAPAIIEYKVDKASTIINQLIFYYDWFSDHSDTFDRLARERIGKDIIANWSEGIRLICIAKEFTEWDFALVSHLKTKIELFKYTYYTNGLLHLQEIGGGKIAAVSPQQTFDLEYHRSKGNREVQEIFDEIRKRILDLDEEVEERVTKFYVGYYKHYLFVEIHIQQNALVFQIKARGAFSDPKRMTKDISHLGFAVNREFRIHSKEQIPDAMFLINQSFKAIQEQ